MSGTCDERQKVRKFPCSLLISRKSQFFQVWTKSSRESRPLRRAGPSNRVQFHMKSSPRLGQQVGGGFKPAVLHEMAEMEERGVLRKPPPLLPVTLTALPSASPRLEPQGYALSQAWASVSPCGELGLRWPRPF